MFTPALCEIDLCHSAKYDLTTERKDRVQNLDPGLNQSDKDTIKIAEPDIYYSWRSNFIKMHDKYSNNGEIVTLPALSNLPQTLPKSLYICCNQVCKGTAYELTHNISSDFAVLLKNISFLD